MINYSIIIPHKNIPNLLQRCLDSIPNREDVQIIVVDDNSDPNIVDFDKFPGLNRSNVEVIFTKEGKGAGYARNTGIKYVKGKWLLFSDADDYFSENVNRLFDDYENSVMDVIYIPYKTIDLITGEDLEDGLCVTNLEEDLYKKRSDTLRYRCYSPWAKMVKVSMIERYSIRFEEVVASNDVWFSVNVGYVAKEIDICNYIVYIRNVRYGSLQYSLNKEYLLSRIKVGYKVNDFLYDINKIEYYVNQCEVYNLDVRQLRNKIKSNEYERIPDDVRNRLKSRDDIRIIDFVKNPIHIRNSNKKEVISEKILQKLILEDISTFLKELGNGFTFIDNEYKIKLDDRYNYIDLLLYNIKYKCYVVVELKVTELKKGHTGQIMTYMNYIDKNIKTIEENDTVGIIICKQDNEYVIKYCSDDRIIAREYELV